MCSSGLNFSQRGNSETTNLKIIRYELCLFCEKRDKQLSRNINISRRTTFSPFLSNLFNARTGSCITRPTLFLEGERRSPPGWMEFQARCGISVRSRSTGAHDDGSTSTPESYKPAIISEVETIGKRVPIPSQTNH